MDMASVHCVVCPFPSHLSLVHVPSYCVVTGTGVSSLLRAVTKQCHGREWNSRPLSRKSNVLTITLSSHKQWLLFTHEYNYISHLARNRAKCIVTTAVCVCACVCLTACLQYCTDPDVTWGNSTGWPLVVHYWADLQSVHGFRCYGNISA